MSGSLHIHRIIIMVHTNFFLSVCHDFKLNFSKVGMFILELQYVNVVVGEFFLDYLMHHAFPKIQKSNRLQLANPLSGYFLRLKAAKRITRRNPYLSPL